MLQAGELVEGLHSPRGVGLAAACPQGANPSAELCVLGACCPGSSYPVEQLGWHKQISLLEEVLEVEQN